MEITTTLEVSEINCLKSENLYQNVKMSLNRQKNPNRRKIERFNFLIFQS